MTFVESFREAMRAKGLTLSGEIKSDGALHRFTPDEDGGRQDDSAWYVLHSDEPAAGAFGCWRRGISEKWFYENGQSVYAPDMARVRKRWAESERQRQAEEAARHQRMADKAEAAAKSAAPAPNDHPYLQRKGVGVLGALKLLDDDLLLPLQDVGGKIWSSQTIDAGGDKLFMPGGRVQGCFFPIGHRESGPLVVCEGYATGATIHFATGWDVVCAMNCGNLKAVCQSLRSKWKARLMVVAADNDRFTEGNPGLAKAGEAAKSVRAFLAVPEFSDTDLRSSDFNDLERVSGSAAVKKSFAAVGCSSQMTIDSLLAFQPDADSQTILGRRYLCRGGSCVIVGSTSVGKSSLGLQMAVMFAIGCGFFGLKPVRPMRSLFIQAENDLGDMAEILQGVLLGTGLVREGNADHNAEVMRMLNDNLIIIRDQTHTGADFGPFVNQLIDLHQPDFVWMDPFMSFYGNDINNQQEMTAFLRQQLNPISERNGICWMILHHTGKPSKDAAKTQKHWSARDFAYMGIGSSELSNWARAIITLTPTSEDEFRLIFAKRGWRAGVCDESGNPASELHIAHGGDHICWKMIPKPLEKDETTEACRLFAVSLEGKPMKATEIVKLATVKLKRGLRTCWTLWDKGKGPLGRWFIEVQPGSWAVPAVAQAKPYKDD